MSEFIILHNFFSSIEAEIFKSKLESEGIESAVLDENTTYSIGPTITTGFRLQVREENYPKAKEILEKFLQNQ